MGKTPISSLRRKLSEFIGLASKLLIARRKIGETNEAHSMESNFLV